MEAINTTVVGDNNTFYAQEVARVAKEGQAVNSVQSLSSAQTAVSVQATASPVQTSQAGSTDFATALRSLVCPQCNSLFGAQVLSSIPKMTPQIAVEADFHRLLPHVSFRGALVTICPACEYAGWVDDFGVHSFPADMVPSASELEPSIKYAYAIKKGRELKSPALNLALLSLNGLWCARQENKAITPWLELTIKELSAALDDNSWRGNRPYYLYLRGELRRQNSQFDDSLRDLEQTVPQMKVPQALIERQKQLALVRNSEPMLLPSHLVQQIFCFTPSSLQDEHYINDMMEATPATDAMPATNTTPTTETTETTWKI